MTNLFTELLKFFSEFTWKKLFSIFVMLIVAFVIVSVYEIYTSAFRFSRLQKAADLLSKIEELDSHETNASPELTRAKIALVSQVVEAIDTKPITLDFIPSTLRFSMDGLWKFLASASFWWVIALTQIRGIRDAKRRDSMGGMFLAGVLTGVAGMFVHSVWWPWFHIFIFPWVFILCIGVLVLPVTYFMNRRMANMNSRKEN